MAKEVTTKITKIGENAILGCSGSDNYISLLEETFEDSFSSDVDSFKASIPKCVREYGKEVSEDAKAIGYGRNEFYTDSILCFSDSKKGLHLFHIPAPLRPSEKKKPPFRLSVGSGGFISDFIMHTIEERVFNIAELGWEDLMVQEVMQFSTHLLYSVGLYEKNTSTEAKIWYLNTIDRIPRQSRHVNIWRGLKGRNYLMVFIKTVLANHPEQVKRWVNHYMDDDLRQRFFELFVSP